MAKKNGSFIEQLVEVIERSISPESTVERNVFLPILGSANGSKAQCDIIIRTGKFPRETITIVEVQDRDRPVEINEFRGWTEKMRSVGAQHLYCVSKKPFPKSIRELAILSGNTVKLILLRQLDENQIPINFFKTTFMYVDWDVRDVKKLEVVFPSLISPEKMQFLERVRNDLSNLKTNDLKFSIGKVCLKALSTICSQLFPPGEVVCPRTDILSLGYDERQPLFYLFQDEFIPIKLRIQYTWFCRKVEIPVSILSYEQNNYGALAWVIESYYNSSRGPIWIKMPVTKNDDFYSLPGIMLTIPDNIEFSFMLERESFSDNSTIFEK
jgi:hypothetical protein